MWVTGALHGLFLRFRREEGQTMAEYAVILGVIAVGVLLAIGLLSGAIQDVLDRITDALAGDGDG